MDPKKAHEWANWKADSSSFPDIKSFFEIKLLPEISKPEISKIIYNPEFETSTMELEP